MLPIHIAAGGLAIVLGAVALLARKGGTIHRRGGLFFVYAMVVIAAGSFFSIRERVAKVLPAPFTAAPLRILPILLVFVAMFYWLWRVRRGRLIGAAR